MFHLSDKTVTLRAVRITAWALATAIVVLSVVPPSMRPETGMPHVVEHFGVYLLTGLAFGFGYARRPGLLAILLVVFSGLVEIVQLSVPGRHARLSDFIVEALAALIGLTMGWRISTTQRRSDVSNETLLGN